MQITEEIDNVKLSIAPDGTLQIDAVTLPPAVAVALRLFVWRPDVDAILNELELIAGQLAE